MPTLNLDDLSRYGRFAVVDLEATCADDDTIPPAKMETIEIGAVVVEAADFAVAGEFQAFVRPLRNPVLTAFCTDLTGITQDMVASAETFFSAFGAFDAWIKAHAAGAAFCSWGAYDRRQLQQDCAMHGLAYGLPPHANLKDLFSVRQGRKKRFRMARALGLCGIELAGRHHRALDDARNIARLLPWIVGDRVVGR